jgi:serine/threonine-protein kinase
LPPSRGGTSQEPKTKLLKAERAILNENERLIAGRYRLGALVGRGGMAEVFEGYDTRLGRTIAIKLLKSDLANDAGFEAKFRQEAQASARMAHPTIVRVYDAGEEETVDENGQTRKTPFIVMELVRGQLLREVIHQGKVETARAIKYVSGILTALEVSHNAGVVHRDIKPANVMIGEGDTVKVMDFGIARAISDNSTTQAATGGIMGTAQYFSPEQARGEGVDGRTDLYSTGVILYELLTGRPPFTGESAVSVAYQHVSEAVTPPSQFNPAVSAELDEVVLRAMAKDREGRFQSAAEFREHLLAAGANTASAPIVPTPVADRTEVISTPTSVMTPSNTDELLLGFQTAPNDTVSTATTSKIGVGVMWGLGTGVAVILVGLLFWVMSIGGGSSNPINQGGIVVTSVEGSLYEDAFNTLSEQDLLVLRVYEKSDTVPEGVVIRQEPVAGTNVSANTPVTLYVSSGATEVTVPNVISIQEAAAVALIEAQGLTIGTITVISSATVPEGIVIASDPAIGQKLPLGSVVNLTLSNGKVLVPDVRNLTVLEARTILTATTIGYTVSIEIVDAQTCSGTPGNVVVEQSVLPGEAPQLQNIVLYVQCVGGTPSPTPTPTQTTQG